MDTSILANSVGTRMEEHQSILVNSLGTRQKQVEVSPEECENCCAKQCFGSEDSAVPRP